MIVSGDTGDLRRLIDGVQLKNLAHSEQSHLVEVHLAKGVVVPEHQHPQEQTGYLISGQIRFFSGDENAVANPGDSWNFPGGTLHGAEALKDTIVIEVFVPMREDYLALD